MLFTERQNAVLQAMVNRIIPADDFPGGWEGGVGSYLARQFEGDLAAMRPIYELGLDALEGEAEWVYEAAFDALPAGAADLLLTDIEAGEVETVWPVDPRRFFNMVVQHCAEGYYSDPGNGGNHDGLSWKMIGFEVRE